MRFGVEFRSHWRAWLAAALLAGLAGGILVAVAAGARRTDSAWPRYQAAYHFRNARLWGGSSAGSLEPFEHLHQVEAGSIAADIALQTPPSFSRSVSHFVSVYASVDGNDGRKLDLWKVLAGRLPNEKRVYEAVLDSRAARTFGVEPGDTIRLNLFGRRVPLKVVAVVASTDPVGYPAGVVRLTRAFYLHHRSAFYADFQLDVRLKRGVAGFPAFRRAVDRNAGSGGWIEFDQSQRSSAIQGSIDELVQALWLGLGAVALLAFVLLAQSLSRLSIAASGQYRALRAIGMTSRQLFALGIVRAATLALFAAAVAVGVALALSPLAPIGYARELEPTPGFHFDPLVVGLGGTAVFAAVLTAGAFAAWRAAEAARARTADGPARVRAADALARWGLPAPVSTGVRLALAGRRGASALSAGSALAGVTLAVVVTAAALTFSASLHHLFSTPRLFGQNWDFRSDTSATDPKIPAAVNLPAVSALATGTDKGSVVVNGREVGVWAMRENKGSIQPTILAGRVPGKKDEIALGTKTMRALGVRIGYWVKVAGSRGLARMRVVGRVVLPSNYNTQLGEGAVLNRSEWFDRLAPLGGGGVLLARIRPGANRAKTLRKLEGWFGGSPVGLPAPLANFGGVNELPAAISAFLVVFSLGALTLALVGAVRRRRRYLAILKTLGFDRRQVLATVVWQATTLAAIGLLIGLPVGNALGRWVWNLFADQLGVVPVTASPIPFLLLVIPGAILLANGVAIIPARIAARTRPALVLRAE
jgi:ABC-type lipoprotein release transport system permease subunit